MRSFQFLREWPVANGTPVIKINAFKVTFLGKDGKPSPPPLTETFNRILGRGNKRSLKVSKWGRLADVDKNNKWRFRGGGWKSGKEEWRKLHENQIINSKFFRLSVRREKKSSERWRVMGMGNPEISSNSGESKIIEVHNVYPCVCSYCLSRK